jgi:HD-GYP domain-containing protein (c-di-GMP phosphodiesterase class II)
MAVKIAKIYEPNNRIFIEQIYVLFSLIQDILKSEEEASFMLRQSSLFFNGMKVRFTFSNYNLFRFISTEFHRRKMNLLKFKKDVIDEEVRQFVILLSKKEEESEAPFEDFLTELKKNGIEHIAVEKMAVSDESQSNEKYAAKVFFLGITHLKEMFESFNKDEKIPLNVTRRLMQSMFNHLVDNEAFVYGLTNIKNFDEYTLNHSVNVCLLSIALGKHLGLDKNELVDLGMSAFFHDFGKTEIPKDILLKPGKLNDKEREIIERHPYLGAEKLAQLQEDSYMPLRAVNVAMEHHVREDLSGYPQYKSKKSVNLFSKIVKICDFFDALTTERPYRKRSFSRDEVLGMMMEMSGLEFDPILLKVFVNMMGIYPVGTLVLLDTEEMGIVFEINMEPVFLNRPKLKLITDKRGNKIDGEIVDLTEADPQTDRYRRTIIKSLDPKQYSINVSEYFLAEAQ